MQNRNRTTKEQDASDRLQVNPGSAHSFVPGKALWALAAFANKFAPSGM